MTNDIFTPDMPKDFGISQHRNAGGIRWAATRTWTNDPQVVDRDTLGPKGAIYSTFYATVGAATKLRVSLPGNSGDYGAEWCHGNTVDTINGFDCDASHWWNPLTHPGTSAVPTERGYFLPTECSTGRTTPIDKCRELGVKAGQPYQLRDIDCWDGRISPDVPAYASLVAISGFPACNE